MTFLDTNLLEQLEQPEFTELRAAFNVRSFAAKSLIYTPDETENLVFIVRTGRARVYLAFEDKEFSLGILGEGDIFTTHSGTFIQALDPVELLVTDVDTFRRRMTHIPKVTTTMVKVLGNLLRNSFSIIDGLVFMDANKRLAAYLLHEARKHGEEEDGGMVVHINLPVEQIAHLIGATRQTVSTMLNDLARRGLLEKRARGLYFIPDLDELERTSIN